MLLAIWAARRIAAPIEQIEQGTHALLRREPIAFAKTGVSEVDRALDAFVTTAGTLEQHEKDRDEREAHVRLIMRELSHRSKNLLAIVLAIARQTSRTTKNFEEFEERFNARIQALADAHDLLVEQQWAGAALDDLVRAQLSAFGTERVSYRRRKGDAARRGGAERRARAARACHQRVEIRRAVGPRRPGRDRMGAARRRSGEARHPPDVARDRRAAGDASRSARASAASCWSASPSTRSARAALEFKPSGLVWTCDINAEHLVWPPGKNRAEGPTRTPAAHGWRRSR